MSANFDWSWLLPILTWIMYLNKTYSKSHLKVFLLVAVESVTSDQTKHLWCYSCWFKPERLELSVYNQAGQKIIQPILRQPNMGVLRCKYSYSYSYSFFPLLTKISMTFLRNFKIPWSVTKNLSSFCCIVETRQWQYGPPNSRS